MQETFYEMSSQPYQKHMSNLQILGNEKGDMTHTKNQYFCGKVYISLLLGMCAWLCAKRYMFG
jgi:hypothetical protein